LGVTSNVFARLGAFVDLNLIDKDWIKLQRASPLGPLQSAPRRRILTL
jgi:hypothetical protein